MEKMEVEQKFDEAPVEKTVKAGEPDTGSEMEWICDVSAQTKTCSACKSIMRQWAYREPFKYCPKCGKIAKIAK